MYIVTNCNCVNDVYSNSEPMEYTQALELYETIFKQATRGLRKFPELIDENGIIIK